MISVIMPTYNRAYCIAKSIESVLNQTFSDWELIIVDDASTDNTADTIDSVNDNRIRYIKHTTNKGPAAARNTGWQNAKGEYLTFLDSDDIWYDNYLETQYDAYIQRGKTDGIQICKYKFHVDGKMLVKPVWILDSDNKFDVLQKMLTKCFITSQIIFMPKQIMKSIDGFDETTIPIEDFELGLRIADKFKIYQIDDILAEIFISKDSLSLRHEISHQAKHRIYEIDYDILQQRKILLERYNYMILHSYLYDTGRIDKKALRRLMKINPVSILLIKFFAHWICVKIKLKQV